jgi:hypothetical protein
MANWIKVGAVGKWIQMAYNKAGISSVDDFIGIWSFNR